MTFQAGRMIERVSKIQVHTFRTSLERVSRSRWRVVFVCAIAVVVLVLTVLALMAGQSPGFMEDYHILLLNTSTLG